MHGHTYIKNVFLLLVRSRMMSAYFYYLQITAFFFYHKPFEKYENVDHLTQCVANVQLFVNKTPNVTQLLVRKFVISNSDWSRNRTTCPSSTLKLRITRGNKMPTRCQQIIFIADLIAFSTCFGAPLCPSSGAQEYYTCGCCLWYLVLWFSSCRYGVELRDVCPVCGLLPDT